MPKIPPPAYAAAGLLAQHLLSPKPRRGSALRTAVATAFLGASVGLVVLANQRFHRHGTTVNPVDPTRATTLVTDGVFEMTRNPMYVGLTGLLTAHAVFRGGWLTPLPAAAFAAVIDRVQIPAEERALGALFGEAYDRYRAAVPRWLGPT